MMLRSVVRRLRWLQTDLREKIEGFEEQEKFLVEDLDFGERGTSRPMVLSGGNQIEKAAVNFTESSGESLPPAATLRYPDRVGQPFKAASLSVIVHPRNPFAPCSHLNLRFFMIGGEDFWHFGGGFDLTPTYGYESDSREWHQYAKQAVQEEYEEMKTACDQYFYLPHRDEQRGIGGLFFEDWRSSTFEKSLEVVMRVGTAYRDAYVKILKRRTTEPYTAKNREFQLYRRGRYVEFNLLKDRGTKYGLESGRRVESVLASMPPIAKWEYNFYPEKGSAEEKLTKYFLKPRDWLKKTDPKKETLSN